MQTQFFKFKSNLHYNVVVTPKQVLAGEFRIRGLAPERHSFEETSQWWRAVGDTESDLSCPGFEPRVSLLLCSPDRLNNWLEIGTKK